MYEQRTVRTLCSGNLQVEFYGKEFMASLYSISSILSKGLSNSIRSSRSCLEFE